MNANADGFSLIEVLVALVILAVVMLSVAELSQHSIRFSNHFRNQVDARWIAQNALAELQLGLSALPGETGQQSQEEDMDNSTWIWKATSSRYSHNILNIHITVKKKNNSNFAFHYQGYARGSSL